MNERTVPNIFDRGRTAAKFRRAQDRQSLHGGASYLSDAMADDICERIDFMQIEADTARVVGDASGALDGHLSRKGTAIDQGSLGEFNPLHLELPGAFDLIAYFFVLGMVNDLPGALIRARGDLSDGGLFFAAFPGAGSMPALRQITLSADGDRPAARIHPQVDNRAGTALLERAGFKRQVVDSFPLNVRYSTFERMIGDLRDHGLTSSLSSPAPALDRAWADRARAAFDALREDDGKVTETFEILVLTGWN